MRKWIILALILRIFLMSVTAHSDFWDLVIGGYLWAEKGIVNVWDYYLSLPTEHELVKSFTSSFFPYPPLTLLTFGVWTKLLSPFTDANFLLGLFTNLSGVYQTKGVVWHLFWYKLLYLFFDFGIGWLLWRSFVGKEEKRRTLLLWLFNPLVFYSLAVGNFDLIPTFWVVLSLYWAERRQMLGSSLALGIGAAYKMFPLFFLPLLVVLARKSLWEKLKIALLGLAPWLISVFAFWPSPGFRAMVLFSPLSQRWLESKLMVSGAEGISLVAVGMVLVYLFFAHRGRGENLWRYYLAVLLVFFSFTDYHLQWFVWLAPFLVMVVVKDRFTWGLVAILVACWVTLVALATPDLHLGLFVPLKTLGLFSDATPGVVASLSPAKLLTTAAVSFDLRSLVRSLFAAASLVLIWGLLNVGFRRTRFL